MNISPFFSIILPTYNRAFILSEAIESVIAQSISNWELIIVDDGSTDNTREVVTSFQDLRVRYYYQQNAERSAARNKGIELSNGRYICFLDSDDYYMPNHLECLEEAISSKNSAIAVFITDVIRDTDGELQLVEHEDINLHQNNVCYILCAKESVIPSRLAVHTDVVKQFQFDRNLKVSEDAELLSRIGAKYPFIQVPFHTAVYRIHESNTTNRKNNPYPLQLVALKKIFSNPAVKPLIPTKIKNQKLSACYFGIAQYHDYMGQHFKLIKAMLKSITLAPFSGSIKTKLYLIAIHLLFFFKLHKK